MGFIDKIKENWQAAAVILGIIGGSIFSWNYAMAQAEAVAEKKVQATINKAMIDGAKDAAAAAVKDQLPAIAKEVAQQTATAVIQAQREEAAKAAAPK